MFAAKERFEANGWRVIHEIVDSVWVEATRRQADATRRARGQGRHPAEYEGAYDWIGFVPKREQATGALTKYFDKKASEDAYKVRGIEIRPRSTPEFIADAQRRLMEALDAHRSPEAVVDVCQWLLRKLRAGDIHPEMLVIKIRTTKRLKAYSHGTHTIAALPRYQAAGIPKSPGQDVRYVVVDDGAMRLPERVRLHFEAEEEYDAGFYAAELIRACESVISPMGWDQEGIRAYLRDCRDSGLAAFE